MEVAEQKQRENDLKQKFREHYNKEKERAEEAEDKVAGKTERLDTGSSINKMAAD